MVTLPEYVVTGIRASMESAQARKRETLEISDSIVADDIGKLPDVSVSDALQRITGIQITRDRGEGGSIQIRGLSQVETTLNGREYFTAGGGRGLNLQDIPSELVAGIDVYKTFSADMIEGGLGGTVNVRTHRPFDFKGLEVAGTFREVHGDLAGESKPQYSGLFSNRWKLSNGGEIGFLVDASHQERAYREDLMSTGTPAPRTDLVEGKTVYLQNGSYQPVTQGVRKRDGLYTMLQYRPSDLLELYAEASYERFKTEETTHGISIAPSSDPVAGSVTLFPGTNDVKSATFNNSGFTILSFLRPTDDKEHQFAVGGRWTKGALTMNGDLSYTYGTYSLIFNGIFTTGTAPTFHEDVSTFLPTAEMSGFNALDPSLYNVAFLTFTHQQFEGKQTAGHLDGKYSLSGGGFLRSIKGGIRYSKHTANDGPGNLTKSTFPGKPFSDFPGLYMPFPYSDYFSGSGTPVINSYIVAKMGQVADIAKGWPKFGEDGTLSAPNPLSIWDINETTSAAYLMADFETQTEMKLDGNIGVRFSHTKEAVSGYQVTDPLTGATGPIGIDSSYNDVLPSLNARLHLNDTLLLRFAASKSITRPNFSQLSPSLTLTRNLTNAAQNSGAAGNPALKPMRSNNFDLSLEEYFSKSGSVYAAIFYKKVEGFPTTVVAPEVHDGITYQISRPQNGAGAKIKGAEVGYQQFFDFLPGIFSGLGVQMNYTYVDSKTPSSVLGLDTPLDNLSKNSYNIIGMYEKGKVQARIAYNWRSSYFRGTSNIVGVGAVPIYEDPYGWLDASVSYQLTKNVKISLEGTNLTNTMRRSYYGQADRRHENAIDDRQIMGVVSFRL